jgi:hypothetical protein
MCFYYGFDLFLLNCTVSRTLQSAAAFYSDFGETVSKGIPIIVATWLMSAVL